MRLEPTSVFETQFRHFYHNQCSGPSRPAPMAAAPAAPSTPPPPRPAQGPKMSPGQARASISGKTGVSKLSPMRAYGLSDSIDLTKTHMEDTARATEAQQHTRHASTEFLDKMSMCPAPPPVGELMLVFHVALVLAVLLVTYIPLIYSTHLHLHRPQWRVR